MTAGLADMSGKEEGSRRRALPRMISYSTSSLMRRRWPPDGSAGEARCAPQRRPERALTPSHHLRLLKLVSDPPKWFAERAASPGRTT
jgi:hypothetical protein